MGSKAHSLRVFFFPMMASGHMIPMVDIAKLFAARGVRAAIVTTPANAPLIQPSIHHYQHPIELLLIPFPSGQVGLPEGSENVRNMPTDSRQYFLRALDLLREPFDRLLRDHHPDAVVTDMFMPWTADVAREHGIPRLVFHGTSFFSLCASDVVYRHKILENLPDGAESVVLPGFPHRIELLRSQIANPRDRPEFAQLWNRVKESETRSYGVVVNSFYEMEPDYAEHYRTVLGTKAWHVGPVSLCNGDDADKAARGDKSDVDPSNCLSWLASQEPDSVVYVCFGSMGRFMTPQLREIASALEACGRPFIWVVGGAAGDRSEWVPEGRGERGLIITGWAPQILILNHEAVGVFVTHCGWNSSLEGMAAGVPMVTWPLFAEQFYNERLIVDVLKVGTPVGVRKFAMKEEDREMVESEAIERAVAKLTGGDEGAEAVRRRAKELGEMARRAMEEGGSSYADMDRLIHELLQVRRSGGLDKVNLTSSLV